MSCVQRRALWVFGSSATSLLLHSTGEPSLNSSKRVIQHGGSDRLKAFSHLRPDATQVNRQFRGLCDTALVINGWKPNLMLQNRRRLDSLPTHAEALALCGKSFPSRRRSEVGSEKPRMNAAHIDIERWELVRDEIAIERFLDEGVGTFECEESAVNELASAHSIKPFRTGLGAINRGLLE